MQAKRQKKARFNAYVDPRGGLQLIILLVSRALYSLNF